MTIQEAIESMGTARLIVELESPVDYEFEYNIVFDMAINALESQTKYRWHDLKKDPNDLPDDEEKKIAVCQNKKGTLNYVMAYYSGRWVAGVNSNVVAWRDIEPFEVAKSGYLSCRCCLYDMFSKECNYTVCEKSSAEWLNQEVDE